MNDNPRIAVIGSNMIDLITNVDAMPRKGETVVAPHFDLGFGGKGANQAVAAAMLGAEVVMVTKVGDDFFGREVKHNFESFGIDTTFIEPVENVSNGVAPIFVDQSGDNYILIIKGANSYLKEKDIEKAGGKLIQCDLILLQLEIPIETVYFAIDFGYTHTIPVILNPAPAAELDFERIKKVTMLIPNETELEILTGLPVATLPQIEEAAGMLLHKGVKVVIVTLGEKGSLLVTNDKVELIPAVKVKSKDTTGAGDAFIGSLVYFYIRNGDLVESMKYANHYAAFSTLKTGTQKSFNTREEFENLLKQYMHP